MALPVSTLSIAATEIRKLLADKIVDIEEANVSIDHPQRAFNVMTEQDAPTTDQLNLFFYQIDRDGYPTDGAHTDPFYLRLKCLITALGALGSATNSDDTNGNGNGSDSDNEQISDGYSAGEADLRLMGEVLRVFHQNPIVILSDQNDNRIAQLQIVLDPPTLDDINRLWSTQGETAYRLSVAYEIALAPIPLEIPTDTTARVGAVGTAAHGTADPFAIGDESSVEPTSPHVQRTEVNISQPSWSPHIAFVTPDNEVRYNIVLQTDQIPGNGKLNVAVAGAPGETLEFYWERWEFPDFIWAQETSLPASGSPSSNILDPESINTPLIQVNLPILTRGQAILYAVRKWLPHADGVEVELKSNPLLVTVYQP